MVSQNSALLTYLFRVLSIVPAKKGRKVNDTLYISGKTARSGRPTGCSPQPLHIRVEGFLSHPMVGNIASSLTAKNLDFL